jgi:hypothetical protein
MEAELKPIGYALSGCTHDFLIFVVIETAQAKVNHFYFLKHPANTDITVLTRTFRTQPYNPEMITGRTGPLAGKKGRLAEYGKKLEYTVAFAEILGYYDEKHKWRTLEMAPAPWDYVYEPSEEALKQFFIPEKFAQDALMLELGKVRGTNIPVYIDLNAVARGHMFVAGMTRSGKSSFLINLVAKASKLKPRPRFIVFDRRGEYDALTNYGAAVFSYDKFTPSITNPDFIVAKLGVKGKEKQALTAAVQEIIDNDSVLTKERILAKCQEILDQGVVYKTTDSQAKAYRTIEWCLENKGAFLEEKTKSLDIIESIKGNSILIIDFSLDTDIEKQHRTACSIINEIRDYAMHRKDEGDFACILAVEEAQYLAPEKGSELVESEAQKEVKAAMIETISQAGGYNVGLIIMTQRPAYVLKGCISQCNSVACFRLKSGNDQDAVLMYTEYGSERLRDYLPGLADHEAMLWGIAIPTPFPVITEIKVDEYPRKAAVFAKQAWERMEA